MSWHLLNTKSSWIRLGTRRSGTPAALHGRIPGNHQEGTLHWRGPSQNILPSSREKGAKNAQAPPWGTKLNSKAPCPSISSWTWPHLHIPTVGRSLLYKTNNKEKNHKKCLKQKKNFPDIMKETLSKATCITSSFMFSLRLHKKRLPILHLDVCWLHKSRKAVGEQNDNNKHFFQNLYMVFFLRFPQWSLWEVHVNLINITNALGQKTLHLHQSNSESIVLANTPTFQIWPWAASVLYLHCWQTAGRKISSGSAAPLLRAGSICCFQGANGWTGRQLCPMAHFVQGQALNRYPKHDSTLSAYFVWCKKINLLLRTEEN